MSSYQSALPALALGLVHTISIALTAFVLAIACGFTLGVLRTVVRPALDLPLLGLIEVLRGIPALVLMYLIFFGLTQFGIRLNSDPAAVIALALYAGALASEIVRGAIVSIPRGQTEAASALGLSTWQTLGLVIVPQALRRMAPPFVALFALIVETSSLSQLIGVRDLLESARLNIERDVALAFPLYATVLVLYFLINYPISLLSGRLEKRLA